MRISLLLLILLMRSTKLFSLWYINKIRNPVFITYKHDIFLYCNKPYREFLLRLGQEKLLSLFDLFKDCEENSKTLFLLKRQLETKNTASAIIESCDGAKQIIAEKIGKNSYFWYILPSQATEIDLSEKSVLIEDIPVPICIVDSAGDFMLYNKAHNSFFSKRKLDINNISKLFSGEDEAAFEKYFTKLFASENCAAKVVELKLASCNQYVRLSGKKLLNNSKNAVISIFEITKQKAMEQEISDSQKMNAIGQLAGGIAHDFNNILAAIMMDVDFLLSNHRSSDPAHPDLMSIKQNTNRAAALVQQLLGFSRKQTLQLQCYNLNEVIADTKDLLQRVCGANIELRVFYHPNLPKVRLDKISFQRILMNLIINARDAIGNEKGSIDIEINVCDEDEMHFFNSAVAPGEEGKVVLIRVRDTGCGIETKHLENIFEPFFTTKEVGKGTGLGLAMVYGLIKQMNGHIECDSKLGEGTIFTICFPSVQDEEESQSAIETKEEKQKPKAATEMKQKILIVDDEAVVRKGFVRALQSRGYEIFEAEEASEALTIFKENQSKISLIISDVIMPKMDGLELYNEVRKIDNKIKFMFISGYTIDSFRDKYKIQTNDFYFTEKPVTLKNFVEKVKEILH